MSISARFYFLFYIKSVSFQYREILHFCRDLMDIIVTRWLIGVFLTFDWGIGNFLIGFEEVITSSKDTCKGRTHYQLQKFRTNERKMPNIHHIFNFKGIFFQNHIFLQSLKLGDILKLRKACGREELLNFMSIYRSTLIQNLLKGLKNRKIRSALFERLLIELPTNELPKWHF